MPARKSSVSEPRSAPSPIHQRFVSALDGLVAQIKEDRSVLAAILCGSLSYDTVWARSDIDLALITADDRQAANRTSATLDADGIHVHALIYARGEFRKLVEGAAHNSFMHSF